MPQRDQIMGQAIGLGIERPIANDLIRIEKGGRSGRVVRVGFKTVMETDRS